jgi:hypothetical protein
MISRVHKAFVACLAALVLLGSVQMSAARGAPAPVGTMVICSGHGYAVVLIDAEGQPTRAAHLCPDCAFSAYGPVADHPSTVPFVPLLFTVAFDTPAALWHGPAAPPPMARGPPVLI